MYYSAGVGSLTAFAAAAQLPQTGVFWLAARVMLSVAGGLFAFYLALMVALLLGGHVARIASRGRAG